MNKKQCRLHNSGAIDDPCKEQCVDCGVKQMVAEAELPKTEVETNLVNAYTCGACKQNTVIKHRDKGVTPMFLDCIHCGGKAISHMYKVPQDLEHHLVAFKPKDKSEWKLYEAYLKDYYKSNDLVDKKLLKQMIDATKLHVKNGGVIMVKAEQLPI